MSALFVLGCPNCGGAEFKGLDKEERERRQGLSDQFHREAQARHDRAQLKFLRLEMAEYVRRGWWYRLFHKPPEIPGAGRYEWEVKFHGEHYEGPDPGPYPCERCQGKGAVRVDKPEELENLA